MDNAQITGATQPASSGQTITVTCNNGYTITGNNELTCDGTDFGTLPTCNIQQCATVTVDNAQISPSQPVNFGVTITITCNNGYSLSSGNGELTCDGTDFGTLPTCQQQQCTAITVDNGSVTPTQPVNSGTDITITCNQGFEISGSATLTCSGTSFSGSPPTCNPVSASTCTAVTVDNAQITGATQPASSGQTITVTCNNGYTITGNSELTCDGTDFGTLPTCNIQQCSTITVDNGAITPSQPVNHGVTITVTCNNGYVINGDTELICQGTIFNVNTPTCALPACPVITVDNAEITGAGQPATSGQVITVSCSSGFLIEGSSTLTCTGNSFDNDAPECNTCNELKVNTEYVHAYVELL